MTFSREQFDANQVTALRQAYDERSAEFVAMQKSTLRAKAQRLLAKAALVEIALGQEQELFEEAAYPTSFDENAIKGLRRHKAPWAWMLQIGFEPGLRPANNDPYWAEIKNLARDKLRERFVALTAQAGELQRTLLASPGVASPIIGVSKMQQPEEAVAALEIDLSAEERAYLEQPYVPHPILGHS